MEGGGGFFPFGGDPEELLGALREFAERQAETVQDAQREQFATLTLNTAVELAPRGIRVNAVSAGVVETGALEHFPQKDAMLEMAKRNPVGRRVTPEDVAGCVTFLCSPDAEMIRGQTLVVDGGWSLLASLGGT